MPPTAPDGLEPNRWITELSDAGFVLDSVSEPMSPDGAIPLTLLITARRTADRPAKPR